MPKTAIDYSKCVIYKICCRDPSVTYEYYGHTTNKTNRKIGHKFSCNNETNKNYNLKVYQTIRENGGWNNWQFIVVEEYPCQNVNEATLRERYWIELKQAKLNMNIPSRTIEEWYEEHEGYNKKYYEKNKEQILEHHKKYNEENKEKISEYKKEYYNDNKQIISDRLKKKFICECGSELRHADRLRHMRTQKHINYLNQINNQANENDGA